MTVRFDSLYLMPEFVRRLDQLVREKPALRASVQRILQLYYTDCSRLTDRKPLRRNSHRKIWHTDVDREKRLIDEQLDPDFPESAALLYLDHHDAANRYGERYSGDTTGEIRRGRATRKVTERGTAATTSSPGAATSAPRRPRRGQRGTYGEYLKPRQLRRLGVAPELIDVCLAQPTLSGRLTELGLSEEQADKIDSLYLDRLPSAPIVSAVPGVHAPAPLEVRQDQLAALLRMPLGKFLAQLTDEQVQLATRKNRHLHVIRGAAGSGKTIVGIRRLEYLLDQRDLFDNRPLLFVCHNQVLRDVAEQMIEATLARKLEDARVEVTTIYSLLGKLSHELGLLGLHLAKDHRLLEYVGHARLVGGSGRTLAGWSDEALLAEMKEVIFGRAIVNVEAYQDADRTGRGRALNAHARTEIWKVYERFRRHCQKDGITVWEHLPARLVRHLTEHPLKTARYAGIVIDEVQDFCPAAVQVLLALQAGRTDDIVVLGDAAQDVFTSGFRWKHLGLGISGGQVSILRRCFRSTSAIVAAAMPLLTAQAERLEEDLVLPEASPDDQAPPIRVHFYKNANEELEETAILIASLIENGVPSSAIGVLLDNDQDRVALAQKLELLDCNVEEFRKADGGKSIDIAHPSVKLLTNRSAMGLEFQVLFLPGITEARFPGSADSHRDGARICRELYTSMVRCAWELHLSAPESERSTLFAELGPVEMIGTSV